MNRIKEIINRYENGYVGDYNGATFFIAPYDFDEGEFEDFDEVLELAGIDGWGYDDEYTTCSCCGNIVRTQPDSYGWLPDYWIYEGELNCGDCIRKDPTDYIEHLVNNPYAANTILDVAVIEHLGFKRHNRDFETGWYGQQDDPKEVLNKLAGYDVIFHVHSKGQFDVTWWVFVKEVK